MRVSLHLSYTRPTVFLKLDQKQTAVKLKLTRRTLIVRPIPEETIVKSPSPTFIVSSLPSPRSSREYPYVARIRTLSHPDWSGSLRAYMDVQLNANTTLRYCRIMDWHGEYQYADLPATLLEQEKIDALPSALKARIKAVVWAAWERQSAHD